MNILSGHPPALPGSLVFVIRVTENVLMPHQLQISSPLAKQSPIPYDGLKKGFVWTYSQTYRQVTRIEQRDFVYCIYTDC